MLEEKIKVAGIRELALSLVPVRTFAVKRLSSQAAVRFFGQKHGIIAFIRVDARPHARQAR